MTDPKAKLIEDYRWAVERAKKRIFLGLEPEVTEEEFREMKRILALLEGETEWDAS